MGTNRLEAFSDGVIAIIITIMVLELKVPHGADLSALTPLLPVLCAYVLSFVYVGIYWNNHHHLMHAVQRVNGRVLWANLHVLFWLSLFPLATAWMGENHLAAWPTAVYGFDLFMTADRCRRVQRNARARARDRPQGQAFHRAVPGGASACVLGSVGVGGDLRGRGHFVARAGPAGGEGGDDGGALTVAA
jgi:hypothetical protein